MALNEQRVDFVTMLDRWGERSIQTCICKYLNKVPSDLAHDQKKDALTGLVIAANAFMKLWLGTVAWTTLPGTGLAPAPIMATSPANKIERQLQIPYHVKFPKVRGIEMRKETTAIITAKSMAQRPLLLRAWSAS